MVQTVADVNRK